MGDVPADATDAADAPMRKSPSDSITLPPALGPNVSRQATSAELAPISSRKKVKYSHRHRSFTLQMDSRRATWRISCG